MTRIKGGVRTRQKHHRILKLAKGYRMTRHKQIKKAVEAVLHAGEYAYQGRKHKKQALRRLWIMRISSAVSPQGVKYNQFISGLKKHQVGLDRKILSYLAGNHPSVFNKIVEKVT